jgi:hypothetical protein
MRNFSKSVVFAIPMVITMSLSAPVFAAGSGDSAAPKPARTAKLFEFGMKKKNDVFTLRNPA